MLHLTIFLLFPSFPITSPSLLTLGNHVEWWLQPSCNKVTIVMLWMWIVIFQYWHDQWKFWCWWFNDYWDEHCWRWKWQSLVNDNNDTDWHSSSWSYMILHINSNSHCLCCYKYKHIDICRRCLSSIVKSQAQVNNAHLTHVFR